MEMTVTSKRASFLATAAVLIALTMALFADVIFSSDASVLSQAGLDLFSAEMLGRNFAFGEIAPILCLYRCLTRRDEQ